MYVPHIPLWCWNILGEDAQFFSQPTMAWDGDRCITISGDGSCVARCSIHTWMTEADGSHTTHDIQCGQVAGLAPDGTYLCDYHFYKCWTCRHCHTLLQRETDTWCSAACEAAAAVQPDADE